MCFHTKLIENSEKRIKDIKNRLLEYHKKHGGDHRWDEYKEYQREFLNSEKRWLKYLLNDHRADCLGDIMLIFKKIL